MESLVLALSSFKAMLCFLNYKHEWGSTLGKVLVFIGSRLLAFDCRLVVWFSHISSLPIYRPASWLIFTAWLSDSASVQGIRNCEHLCFYPVLTHTAMVLVYQCIPTLTDLPIAKLFLYFIYCSNNTYLLQKFQILQKVADSWLQCLSLLTLSYLIGL